MPRTRDYLKEILSKRTRLASNTVRMNLAFSRIFKLHHALMFIQKKLPREAEFRTELLKYFPIGSVACIEGYFRLLYRDLIDYGPPYSDNLIGFKDGIRFSIESVTAIQGRAISLGEYVSHFLTLNNLEDINKNTSTIIGEDFLARLKNTSDEPGGTPILNAPVVYRQLNRLFELRHIYCHEVGAIKGVNTNRVKMCLDVTTLFLIVTEHLAKEMMPQAAT